ncbi:MAG: hypothetical protein AB7I27_07230 [Bacteriovoracaceae bacterium]
MRTNALSLPLLFGFLGVLIMVYSMGARAESIVCTTAFGEKTFTIDNNHISFSKEDEGGNHRAVASVDAQSVRTQTKNAGFIKTLYIDGNKHRINIKDVKSFSDVNDYLSITSPKGHEMTYPLSCHSA